MARFVSAIIVAAGSSRRMGGEDKLFAILNGRPVISHALSAFQSNPMIDEIILVVREERKPEFISLKSTLGLNKISAFVSGGKERQDSVWAGIQSASAKASVLLIHDGARPCVPASLIERCILSAEQKGSGVAAMKVTDTIKEATPAGEIVHTLDRTKLWAIQTPQAFCADLLRKSYLNLIGSQVIVTDDAAAVERAGEKVHLVESDSMNLKITTPKDLRIAEAILNHV